MTIQEKNNLLTKSFDEIWKLLWGDFYGTQYRTEEKNAKDKFNQIKEGIHRFDDTFFNLETLIKNSNTNWIEPEWGFPKGRRNYGETDLHCAIREFCEETGIPKNKFSVIKNIIPYDEHLQVQILNHTNINIILLILSIRKILIIKKAK